MSKVNLPNAITNPFAQGIQPIRAAKRPIKNPFFQAHSWDGTPTDDIGVNQPLHTPMFVGYRDNKPVYAGSRLFVLY